MPDETIVEPVTPSQSVKQYDKKTDPYGIKPIRVDQEVIPQPTVSSWESVKKVLMGFVLGGLLVGAGVIGFRSASSHDQSVPMDTTTSSSTSTTLEPTTQDTQATENRVRRTTTSIVATTTTEPVTTTTEAPSSTTSSSPATTEPTPTTVASAPYTDNTAPPVSVAPVQTTMSPNF